MVKQMVVYPYHDTFPQNNKEQAIGKNNNKGESQETHVEWKKSILEDYILHGSTCTMIKMTKLQKWREHVKVAWEWEAGGAAANGMCGNLTILVV